MRRGNKLLATLLSLVLVFDQVPAVAFAATDDGAWDDQPAVVEEAPGGGRRGAG